MILDEPGMFIGVIPYKNSVKTFHGYVDRSESSKKFIYDVFKKGDKAFVSGKYWYLFLKYIAALEIII